MEETETTFAIIKPDAVRLGAVGPILHEAYYLRLTPKRMAMSQEPAAWWKAFYLEHYGRPYFDELLDFMTSGPCVFVLLEGPSAISVWREIIGATDPVKAEPGTIRRIYGTGVPNNAVHGSDSADAVIREALLMNRASNPTKDWV